MRAISNCAVSNYASSNCVGSKCAIAIVQSTEVQTTTIVQAAASQTKITVQTTTVVQLRVTVQAARQLCKHKHNCANSKTTVQTAKPLCEQENKCALCKQQQRIFIMQNTEIHNFIAKSCNRPNSCIDALRNIAMLLRSHWL